MKKAVVVIASVLKPVDDTRMYEKMARSLVRADKFSVNILGFSSNTHSDSSDIHFHSLFDFKQSQYRRLLANVLLFMRLFRLKPSVIIVNTPELAPAILLYKYLFIDCSLVYDVLENYKRNILFHHQDKVRLRRILSFLITFWEKLLVRNCEQILVAEQGYFLEMAWLSKTSAVLIENKVLKSENNYYQVSDNKLTLVYTGTISTVYGIEDALRFATQLHAALQGNLSFVIAGHVTQQDTYNILVESLKEYLWIDAKISEFPVPHKVLLEVMQQANAGIVCHQLLPSIWNCFPTRIWEFMAHEVPFFLQKHPPWVSYCEPWHCAIPIDFTQKKWPMDEILKQWNKMDFYSNGVPDTIYWEEKKFTSVIKPLVQIIN